LAIEQLTKPLTLTTRGLLLNFWPDSVETVKYAINHMHQITPIYCTFGFMLVRTVFMHTSSNVLLHSPVLRFSALLQRGDLFRIYSTLVAFHFHGLSPAVSHVYKSNLKVVGQL